MKDTGRFERKYLLRQEEYYRVKNGLSLVARKDRYSLGSGGSYLVRSLYFDTPDYRAWWEKEDGNFGRIKLRLRVYTDRWEECDKISVEIKTKQSSTMVKYTAFVPLDHYSYFLKHRLWPDLSDPVVEEFQRLLRVRQLIPTTLIQYKREGYAAKDGSPVRITLDHTVSSTRCKTLFPRDPILRVHRPKNRVLEIKTRGAEPAWVQGFVKTHQLSLSSNSKYWQGIEIIRPNMVTPQEAAP